MIPTLHIEKLEPGLYRARLADWDTGEVEFDGPSISHIIMAQRLMVLHGQFM